MLLWAWSPSQGVKGTRGTKVSKATDRVMTVECDRDWCGCPIVDDITAHLHWCGGTDDLTDSDPTVVISEPMGGFGYDWIEPNFDDRGEW